MLSNRNNTTIYTGITNDLKRRVNEHKEKLIDGFTKQYNCNKLVWFEQTDNVESAILHEKRIKKWKREYKIEEIEKKNPQWDDLYYSIL